MLFGLRKRRLETLVTFKLATGQGAGRQAAGRVSAVGGSRANKEKATLHWALGDKKKKKKRKKFEFDNIPTLFLCRIAIARIVP